MLGWTPVTLTTGPLAFNVAANIAHLKDQFRIDHTLRSSRVALLPLGCLRSRPPGLMIVTDSASTSLLAGAKRAFFVRAVMLPVAAVAGLLAARITVSTLGVDGYALFALAVGLAALNPIGDLGVGAAVTDAVDLLDAGSLQCVRSESWQNRRKVLSAVHQTEHLVVIPDGDLSWPVLLWHTLLVFGRPRGAKYRVLCMLTPVRVLGAGVPSARVQRFVKLLLLQAIACIIVRRRDVALFSFVDSFGFNADRIPIGTLSVLDPVMQRKLPSRAEARRRFGIDEDVLVVGLLGVIDKRKNPEMVAEGCVDAFRHMEGLLLVAGQVRGKVFGSGTGGMALGVGQIQVIDRYLSEDELGAAAATCNTLALMHDNHAYASGMLSLAAQAGAAVIVPKGSRLAAIASAGGFGVESNFSPKSVARSLERVASEREALGGAALRASSKLGTADLVTKLTQWVP
jgi:hypothetical protein